MYYFCKLNTENQFTPTIVLIMIIIILYAVLRSQTNHLSARLLRHIQFDQKTF